MLALLVAVPVWDDAGSVRTIVGWIWCRCWFQANKDRDGRMSNERAPEQGWYFISPDALYLGPARARFGVGMAAVRINAAVKKVLDGRVNSLRKGGARLYATSGMSREALQELAGWKSMGVVARAYSKLSFEEIAPEMLSAMVRAAKWRVPLRTWRSSPPWLAKAGLVSREAKTRDVDFIVSSLRWTSPLRRRWRHRARDSGAPWVDGLMF